MLIFNHDYKIRNMHEIEGILKQRPRKILMVVYPHPDDETFGAGGLLLRAKKLGWKTIVVCLTKGGAGKIFVHGKGRSVVEIRQEEIKKATNLLKVDELILGDFPDAYLNRRVDQWSIWLKSLIQKYSPLILVTYDHSGLTANPDHIIVSLELLQIVKQLKSKPELFWNTIDTNNKKLVKHIVDKRVVEFVSDPTHILTLNIYERLSKFLAFFQYKSQFPLKEIISIGGFIFKNKYEWYHMVDLEKTYKHKFVEFKL
ncbi:PIG-L family deacetylase [Candidatus Microgenomates bacterium]|nr:PIG-L family deacetylase [Candidatus Microgenomates bacterium]